MSPDAKTALLASITHWEENAKVTCAGEANIYGLASALCLLFRGRLAVQDEDQINRLCYNDDLKELCPVTERTEQEKCEGSPWYSVLHYYNRTPFLVDEFQAAARAELAFLKSLLPCE